MIYEGGLSSPSAAKGASRHARRVRGGESGTLIQGFGTKAGGKCSEEKISLHLPTEGRICSTSNAYKNTPHNTNNKGKEQSKAISTPRIKLVLAHSDIKMAMNSRITIPTKLIRKNQP